MSKIFPGLGLGNPHRVRPKTEISRLENHVLKNSMSRFWWTPPVQANSRWQETETIKNAMFSVFKWVISGGLNQLFSECSLGSAAEHRVTNKRTGLSELIYKMCGKLKFQQIITFTGKMKKHS
jgi:hypothetical protein